MLETGVGDDLLEIVEGDEFAEMAGDSVLP